ncbi:hypothetical protein JKF63_06848 [Porcisia hertigi]|uniref:Uncharacterized protein n=1 Tax=Porcisia hertigi TaxID=2761500 RepID=A0A836LJ80_9TRYP|nr:hypothetical protein JKF63_06848 [Porcisia hertigi]
MSATPCDSRLPPLASSSAINDEHEIPPTPTSSPVPGAPPLTQPHLAHTPPSPSNAQLLAGVHPTIMPFLSGLSGNAASTIPKIAGTVMTLDLPTTESKNVDNKGHRGELGTASTALSATPPTSDRILVSIYNEKLQASIRSIITTLTTELPQDHIFLQLLADPATLQYCKVRLAEVVEGFLYSTQAEQYHALATDFARGERDCALLHQRVEELEAALATARAPSRLSTPQQQGISSLRATSVIGEDRAHQSAASAPITSSVSTSMAANPMEDEEARRELLRILEQATHDQELHRCSQALQAVSKVVDVAYEEPLYEDKYLFEGELLGELYKCVHSLLHYIDDALESQERLRCEVQEQRQQQNWRYGAAADSKKRADRGAVGGSAASTDRSASASTRRDIRGDTGVPMTSDCSTPQRPRVLLGNVGTGPMSGAVGGRPSSAPPSADVDHTRPIQQQRGRLQRLAEQLREGQQRASQALEALAQMDSARRRKVVQLERAVEAAREEAGVAMSTAKDAQQVQKDSERLRAEHAASFASERTALRDQLADVHAQLAAAIQDAHAAQCELRSATSRAEAAEEKQNDTFAELAALQTAMVRRDAEAQQHKADRVAWQTEIIALKATYQSNIDALQDAARELLCLRVEGAMAGLSALYQEAKVAKAELLEREGYRPLSHQCSIVVAEQREAARHAQVQSQLAESAQVEQAVAQSRCIDALGVLLRSMWADDAIESSATTLFASTGAPDATATHSTDGDDAREATRGVRARHGRCSGSGGTNTPSANTEVPDAASTRGSHGFRLPKTLSGLCTSLEDAYNNNRAHHRARQQTIDSLRAELVSKDIELRAAQASEAQLREQLKVEQAKEKQWKLEMLQLGEHNPMRELLARQDTLLKAVSDERNELRRLWNRLSSDYIALEQRNGTLHARCAEKEHENARLSGMLRRGGGTTTTTTNTPTSSGHHGAAEAVPGAPKTMLAVTTAHLGTLADHRGPALGSDTFAPSTAQRSEGHAK